ncbi:hypothetical protein IJ732_00165 [bacterium]|nr:hypothetical protein [bacterium]
MHKRWYDVDPTVSLAVSLIRNSDEETQVKCAEFIVDYAKEHSIKLKGNTLNDAFNYILRRWYDKNMLIAKAFDYFECASLDIKKELALDVINFLQNSSMKGY